MKFLGIYNDTTKKYVEKAINYLTECGYDAESMNIDVYSYQLPVTTVPTFLILINGKVAYPLAGKQDLSTIRDWATNSGAICN